MQHRAIAKAGPRRLTRLGNNPLKRLPNPPVINPNILPPNVFIKFQAVPPRNLSSPPNGLSKGPAKFP